MITAKEARELAGPTFEERVKEQLDHAYKQIQSAAEKKLRSVNLTTEFWTRGGYYFTKEYKSACDKLKELEFTVRFVYEERQFVNMYTVVEW